MAMTSFSRLVRYENESGNILYGELSETTQNDSLVGSIVQPYEGATPWDPSFRRTTKNDTIKRVLAPLAHVPIFLGVGLNYKRHANETGSPIPKYPILFHKPSHSLAGPDEDIPIPKEAGFLDYEGELCVIIGKDCKDLTPEDNVLEFILGYTVGNDLSSRLWQHPDRSGHQAGYAKGFDHFAPIGPIICSTSQIPDPKSLMLTTSVNGHERQRTEVEDLIFDVEKIVRFASTGHTLERGTVIMTGTPSGVAAFMKPPPWLQNDDIVEVEIQGIGKIKNRMVFEK